MKTFTARLLLCVAFGAPTTYVALVSAVAVHELLGHGLAARLLGGTFTGFALMPDGMGWAAVSTTRYENFVLAAGVLADLLFGLTLSFIAFLLIHPLWRMTCLLFAACTMLDALPYAFWNCVFVRPPGDFGRILLDVQSAPLRWSLMAGFSAGYLAATIGFTIAIFRCLESLLGQMTKAQAVLVAWGVMGLGGSLSWFTFDWNQVIEDVGRTPQYVGAALQIAMAPVLVAIRRRELVLITISNRSWALWIISAWLVAGCLVVSLFLWLQHGVYWATILITSFP